MVWKPTEDHHAIVLPDSQDLELEPEALRIPLSISGATSYLPTWKPSKEEFELTPLCN